MKLNKDYARRNGSACVHQLAEIAVLGDEHAAFAYCALHDLIVGHALGQLADGENIVASIAQGSDYGASAALVG